MLYKCTNCEELLSPEMRLTGMCFNCGIEFAPDSTNTVRIIQYDGNVISFPDIKNDNLLNNRHIEIKTSVEKNLSTRYYS